MKYHAYELAHAMVKPWRMASQGLRYQLDFPFNPLSGLPVMRSMSAACSVFERLTDRYGKPEWEIHNTKIKGQDVPVSIKPFKKKPFCDLLRFERADGEAGPRQDPKVLLVAPMSGHYATLLRGTVQAMIPEHDVYVTDWIDAREVPTLAGRFDLDTFIDYIIEFTQLLGPDVHIMAVCQPAVPCLAATAIMAGRDTAVQPLSLTMMGGPIDTRSNPTVVNKLAEQKPLSWFEDNVISHVPFPHPGFMRAVYPGFIQLTGFMTMNLERHREAHWKLFDHLVQGDDDSVTAHEKFYDEYLAVMDLPAEFYLQTIKTAFQSHSLPLGTMVHRDEHVDCSKIKNTRIITIEGENDDICGIGQTSAAHRLCSNVPEESHFTYIQPNVGHYGVFNGRRWREEIQPRIRDQIRIAEQTVAGKTVKKTLHAVTTD